MPLVLKFDFTRFPAEPTPAFPTRHSILLPVIPVRIRNKLIPEKYFDLKAMIDSGADISIFPAEVGESVGLDIINNREQRICGIDGGMIKTYLHEIILEIGGWKFNTFACFSFDKTIFPILGREGFFSLFEVKINYLKAIIELKASAEPLKG